MYKKDLLGRVQIGRDAVGGIASRTTRTSGSRVTIPLGPTGTIGAGTDYPGTTEATDKVQNRLAIIFRRKSPLEPYIVTPSIIRFFRASNT